MGVSGDFRPPADSMTPPNAKRRSRLPGGVKPILLAIVGMSGTGKSEAARYLARRYRLPLFYMGGVVLRELQRRGLSGSSVSERKVREQLRRRLGMAAIARLALPTLRQFFRAEARVLLDGLYSAEELAYLRRYSKEFSVVVLALHSDMALRYGRLKTRPVRPLTAAEVDLRDRTELGRLNKAVPIVLADFHVCNNGTTRLLHRSLRNAVAKLDAFPP
jgi:dephospho-CoA kinase